MEFSFSIYGDPLISENACDYSLHSGHNMI